MYPVKSKVLIFQLAKYNEKVKNFVDILGKDFRVVWTEPILKCNVKSFSKQKINP